MMPSQVGIQSRTPKLPLISSSCPSPKPSTTTNSNENRSSSQTTTNPSSMMAFHSFNRLLALISLALGFLIVWTAISSGVLVTKTLGGSAIADETVKVFHTHNDLAKVNFAIGLEMVSIVDWLLVTETPKNPADKVVTDTIGVTWKMTDAVLEDVRAKAEKTWLRNSVPALNSIQMKLANFRESQIFAGVNPLDVIRFYSDISESIERRLYALDACPNNGFVEHRDPVPSTAYALFIRGMSKRFVELAYGTLYVKSSLPLNLSRFFEAHYASRELIQSAFNLNPRAQIRFWELQERDPSVSQNLLFLGDEMLGGNSNRGSEHLSKLYISSVKEEIEMLMLAKDFFANVLEREVKSFANQARNELAFHVSLAVVALVAVFACLILVCHSIRLMGKSGGQLPPRTSSTQDNAECDSEASSLNESRESLYSLCAQNDKARMLMNSSSFCNKPSCYI